MDNTEIKQLEVAMRVLLTDVLEAQFGERLDAITKQLEKHDTTLYGNGKEGLVEIAHRNQQFVNTFNQVMQSVMVALLIAAVIGIIVLLVTHGQLGGAV